LISSQVEHRFVVMSLRALPGRGVRHRHRHQHQQQHVLEDSTTTLMSYESKRRELVKAVQASLKELYAAGYTRSRATGAIVRLLLQQQPPTSGSSFTRGSPPAAAPPSEADLVAVMRRHQMTDGSAKHLLVVAQWIEQRAQQHSHQNNATRSSGRSKRKATTSSIPSQESAVLRAMDDLVRIVREAPRSILALHSPANASANVSRAPPKDAIAGRASHNDPMSQHRVLSSPTNSAPDSGSRKQPATRSNAAAPRRFSSALESIDERRALASAEEAKKATRNPAPPSAGSVASAPTASRNRKSVRGAAPDRSSAALATATPTRARSDSDVEAERTVASKVQSSHPRAAAESSSASSSAAAGATGGGSTTIASASSSRKRSRSSSGGGDAADSSSTSAKAPLLPSPAPTVRSSAGASGGGNNKRTRTRR
jgi:hypothetical protein